MSEHEELKKSAQAKLVEARRLIDEAGELAKEGQFALHFGEIGDFIPRSFVDKSLFRARAIESLKENGRENDSIRVHDPSAFWGYRVEAVPNTPFKEIPEHEMEEAIEETIERLQEQIDIPSEFREYCGVEEADQWWHPSRC